MQKEIDGGRLANEPNAPAKPAAASKKGIAEQPKACGPLNTEIALEACNSMARSYIVKQINENRGKLNAAKCIPFAGGMVVRRMYGISIPEAERILDYLFAGVTQEGKGNVLPGIVRTMPEKVLAGYAKELRTAEGALSAMYKQYAGSSDEVRRSFFDAMRKIGEGYPTSDAVERGIRDDLDGGLKYAGLCFIALVVERMEKSGEPEAGYSKNFMGAAAQLMRQAAACAARSNSFEEFDGAMRSGPQKPV
ncbi:MAG: hypothetical protein NT157_06880 [Candidatus Micrarchaeota archaeon]|nr:hypothetical protein [Candidatus Micrarchaeota archaeon]